MSKKPESKRQRRIRLAIQSRYGKDVFLYKVHGNEYQPGGLPDLIGVVYGYFFGLEVKEPEGSVSAVQLKRIEQIHRAGGIAGVVVTKEDVFEHLPPVRPETTGGSRPSSGKEDNRDIRRAKNR